MKVATSTRQAAEKLQIPCFKADHAGQLTKSGGFVVAQVSNLLYRRFPIGKTLPWPARCVHRRMCRLEALGYSRLETCATTLATAPAEPVKWDLDLGTSLDLSA